MRSVVVAAMIRLDLGCGPHPREGFIGVDIRDFGQDCIADLSMYPWRFHKAPPDLKIEEMRLADNSIDEAFSAQFVEHLDAAGRINFVNELYRVLKPGAKAEIITPHWAHERAYGDLTHQWPPVTGAWFRYLDRAWREQYAPHNDEYTCDFLAAWGYRLSADTLLRNPQAQQFFGAHYVNTAEDLVATLTKGG